tara:strand:+ start:66 stop:269 length:204 start_codon:yes stop_codon:yes gene_type:complete
LFTILALPDAVFLPLGDFFCPWALYPSQHVSFFVRGDTSILVSGDPHGLEFLLIPMLPNPCGPIPIL